ncbi:MAG: VapE domain-containing protein, partial [Cyanobacteria bacterium P01_D01_bin.56]
EWAELESVFKRKDIATTKAFLSSSVDVVRPPYSRQSVRMERQSIIVGTTNQDEFLSDPASTAQAQWNAALE